MPANAMNIHNNEYNCVHWPMLQAIKQHGHYSLEKENPLNMQIVIFPYIQNATNMMYLFQ